MLQPQGGMWKTAVTTLMHWHKSDPEPSGTSRLITRQKKIILVKENGGDSDYNDALIQVGPAGMGIAETLHYADNLR